MGYDEQLSSWIAAAQKGDKVAYRKLLEATLPLLKSFFQKRINREADVDDLTQTVCLRIHVALGSFDCTQPFEPWLFQIARNVLIDFFRLRSRSEEKNVPMIEDKGEDPDGLSQITISEALSELDEQQCSALYLVKIMGVSISEAAHVTGVTESALKVRVHRAALKLKSLLTSQSE